MPCCILVSFYGPNLPCPYRSKSSIGWLPSFLLRLGSSYLLSHHSRRFFLSPQITDPTILCTPRPIPSLLSAMIDTPMVIIFNWQITFGIYIHHFKQPLGDICKLRWPTDTELSVEVTLDPLCKRSDEGKHYFNWQLVSHYYTQYVYHMASNVIQWVNLPLALPESMPEFWVESPAAPFQIQLTANAPGKARDDGPSSCCSLTICGTKMELLASGFSLAQT